MWKSKPTKTESAQTTSGLSKGQKLGEKKESLSDMMTDNFDENTPTVSGFEGAKAGSAAGTLKSVKQTALGSSAKQPAGGDSQAPANTAFQLQYDQSSAIFSSVFALRADETQVVLDCSSGVLPSMDKSKNILPIHTRLALTWEGVQTLASLLQQSLANRKQRGESSTEAVPMDNRKRKSA
ncbi:MAG: hypothetical protein MI725_12535 [Pirellulales bacterium]|nr:hypothetical protein [Pirellulales bacterium]